MVGDNWMHAADTLGSGFGRGVVNGCMYMYVHVHSSLQWGITATLSSVM